MDDSEITLKLRWRSTWPNVENDFAAEAPGYPDTMGRIILQEAGPTQGQWLWSMTGHGVDVSRAGQCSGYEPSPRKAPKAVENSWALAVRGSALEHAEASMPKQNSYAGR